MHVHESGPPDAPPLLLLHGGGVAGWMWRPVLAALRTPVRALVPDLPGHGRSASADYRSHTETVAALERVLEQRAPLGAVVVGFSLGAQLAVLLTARRPDLVREAVVVSAQAKRLAMPELTLAMLAAAAPLAKWRRFARLQAKELFVPDALMDEYLDTSARISKATLVASVGENIRFAVPEGWAGAGSAAATGGRSGQTGQAGETGQARQTGEARQTGQDAQDVPAPRALVLVGAGERRLMHDSARILHEGRQGSELRVVAGVGHGLPLQRPELLAGMLDARLADSVS